MKRFIRYLYEYEQGQRIRNVGFVKVEQEENSCVVHIHGKGLKLEGDRDLKLYLFFVRDNTCIGVYQGSIENVNPAVNYRLAFSKEDTGGAENYALVDGIIMENSSSRKFAAVWNDMPVDVDHMMIWKPESEEMQQMEEMEQVQQMHGDASESSCGCTEKMEESGMTEPKPRVEEEPEQMQEPEPVPERETHEERMETHEGCQEENMPEEDDGYIKPSRTEYTKIQRQELSRLPRCEWRLANNSFLLHGYYNYHHLMLIDEGEVLWLGVPGVFHEREARAAEAFGFPKFIRISEEEMEWNQDEINTADDFGYWCRKVRR